MLFRSVKRLPSLVRVYTGEVRGPGGGKFGEREHAQEEQYFRKKAHLSFRCNCIIIL